MKKSTFCKQYYASALSDILDGGAGLNKKILTRIRCKSWRCDACAETNRKAWRAALIPQIEAMGGKWSFWTITMPSWVKRSSDKQTERAQSSAGLIRGNWEKLLKRLKRELGTFQYLRVIERHKSGALHLHLLVNAHVTDNREVKRKRGGSYWTSDIMKPHIVACGFGYIHDIKNLNDATYTIGDNSLETASAVNVSRYVTKYMTKDTDASAIALSSYKLRKIQTSRGIKSPATMRKIEREDGIKITWTVKRGGFEMPEILSDRFITEDAQKGIVIDPKHFDGGIFYPPLNERSHAPKQD